MNIGKKKSPVEIQRSFPSLNVEMNSIISIASNYTRWNIFREIRSGFVIFYFIQYHLFWFSITD